MPETIVERNEIIQKKKGRPVKYATLEERNEAKKVNYEKQKERQRENRAQKKQEPSDEEPAKKGRPRTRKYDEDGNVLVPYKYTYVCHKKPKDDWEWEKRGRPPKKFESLEDYRAHDAARKRASRAAKKEKN